jgi:diaminopimelate decarboxylase
MDHFNYHHGQLYAEEIPVAELVKRWGTPLYIYSRATLEHHWRVFDQAFGQHPHLICYSVKANSNLAVLNVLARMGSGFDIVSVGELERVIAAKGEASKTFFSGVGKLPHEIERALQVNIACMNVESKSELEQLNQIATQMGKVAPIALRVNPNIDAQTHPYISTGLKENKFGVNIEDAIELYDYAAGLSHIKITGIACHIGSQLTTLQPFLAAFDKLLELSALLRDRGIHITSLDLGGGLGVRYQSEQPPQPQDYIQAILKRFGDTPMHIILAPGRAIAANAGILVTRVEYLKHTAHRNFAIVDAAMNDLIRPALYQANQDIIPVIQETKAQSLTYDVVGPVCETADFLGKERNLALKPQDLLAIRTAGAYGFVMSSNYNSRPRAAEIMVDKDKSYLVRERETVADLFAKEKILS